MHRISWVMYRHRRSITVICFGIFFHACVFAQPYAASPTITLLSRTYHPGSFKPTPQAMWEFVSAGESHTGWTTLLTLIDRTDAHTQQELDRLAEGIKSNYESHGGKILKAQTMRDASGAPYNYMVVAFEEPAKHRFELNRSEEHTSELQSHLNLVCRLLLAKKNTNDHEPLNAKQVE